MGVVRSKLKVALIKGKFRTSDAERKSLAGRKPWAELVIFKALVLQGSTIFRTIRRNISFAIASHSCGFSALVSKTRWLYREALGKASAIGELFIDVDRRYKFVRRYAVSDASIHDSQKLEEVLDTGNTVSDVWADGAYRSNEIEEKLAERGLKSRIHRRAYRNRELSEVLPLIFLPAS